jgi:uncharacterized membrane protein (DUF485 family)
MDQGLNPSIRDTPDFRELESARTRLSWTLTALMLVIYFGFVFLVAFAPALLGTRVIGSITLGFPLGLGVIVSAIVLTGIYVLRANTTFETLTQRIAKRGL